MKRFIRNIFGDALRRPIGFISDLYGAVGAFRDTCAVFGLTASFMGVYGGELAPNLRLFNAADFPVHLKVLLLVLIAAAIGWGFATITNWLLRRGGDLEIVLGHILVIACASLLISSAKFLFGVESGGSENLTQLFILAGLAISFILARTKYRTSDEVNVGLVMFRTEYLLSFSAFVLFIHVITVFLL